MNGPLYSHKKEDRASLRTFTYFSFLSCLKLFVKIYYILLLLHCHDLGDLGMTWVSAHGQGRHSLTVLELIEAVRLGRFKPYADVPSPPVYQILYVGNRFSCLMFFLSGALLTLLSCALVAPRHSTTQNITHLLDPGLSLA